MPSLVAADCFLCIVDAAPAPTTHILRSLYTILLLSMPASRPRGMDTDAVFVSMAVRGSAAGPCPGPFATKPSAAGSFERVTHGSRAIIQELHLEPQKSQADGALCA